MLVQVGTTQDGKPVFAGIFRVTETYGIPLDILLDAVRTRAVPCWMSYYKEARSAGIKHDRIIARLEPALSDVYGDEYMDYVVKALNTLAEKGILT